MSKIFNLRKMEKGKENALLILENELSKKRDHGVVGIGSMSDTYNPLEIKYKTRIYSASNIRCFSYFN